ncbi:hypothetical protein Q5O14_03075 [Eubacteriaceae bacterium ES2]|nr:hypothetical protein Q5O14_03075 [Eubacteriaceae bacterium ES2]
MRFLEALQSMMVHICIICSITIIVERILDWYNPFMDFMGQSVFVLNTLCVCTLLSGIVFIFLNTRK